jgi:hypothetical protein
LGGTQAVLVIDSNDPGIGASIRQTARLPAFRLISRAAATETFQFGQFDDSKQSDFGEPTFYGRWYISDTGAEGGFAVHKRFALQFSARRRLRVELTPTLTVTGRRTFQFFAR